MTEWDGVGELSMKNLFHRIDIIVALPLAILIAVPLGILIGLATVWDKFWEYW